MTTEDELLSLILGANNYGSGPGYMEADSNPYQRADQRLNFTSDIMRHTGLYQDDLLGFGPEPEMPDPSTRPMAPAGGFQSDLRGVYQQNPLIRKAFEEIEAGADPITVGADVLRLAENDPEMAKYIPTFTDEFTGQPKPAQAAVGSLLTDFAGEVQREKREGATGGVNDPRYQQEMAAYNEQVDAYNDYFVPKSDHELMGSPDLQTFINQSKARAGVADQAVTEFNPTTSGPGGRSSGRVPMGATALRGPDLSALGVSRPDENFIQDRHVLGAGGPESFGKTRQPGRGSMRGSGQPNFAPKGGDWLSQIGTPLSQGTRTGGQKKQERSSAADKAKWSNDYMNKNLEKFGQQRLDRAKGKMNKSQAEKNNETRLKAAYSIIFGEAPPR